MEIFFPLPTGFENSSGNKKDSLEADEMPEVLPCERCADHELHIKQLQERMALMEDMQLKEMDSTVARLRSVDEERQKREEECEGLKRKLNDLLNKSEDHQPRVSPKTSSVLMSFNTIIAGIISNNEVLKNISK